MGYGKEIVVLRIKTNTKILQMPHVGLRKGTKPYVQFQNFGEAAGARLPAGSDGGCGFTAGLDQPTFTRSDEDCASAGPHAAQHTFCSVAAKGHE